MSPRPMKMVALLAAASLIGCSADLDNPVEPVNAHAKPGAPGDAASGAIYQVRLGAEPGSRSNGVMRIEILGGHIAVTVHAAGLMPGQHIPQHIHLNPTCNPGGGILLNLDANLTVPGEGAGVGAAYPVSNRAGVVNYYASRSLADLLNAVNTYRGTALESVDDLLAWLNLDERNGHMHVAVGPPFPAVNCGEVERIR
jgi:hypothetical protein